MDGDYAYIANVTEYGDYAVLNTSMGNSIKLFSGSPRRLRSFVENAHNHNIAVQYWTINDEAEMRRLIEIGADGITTDRPHALKKVMDEYRNN